MRAGGQMFRIKICGVLQESDIEAAASAGADAVGLNFHPPSVRFVTTERAAELAARAAALGLSSVGVFVAASAEEILQIASQCGLDFVQLHGDQSLSDAAQIRRQGVAVIRVIRLPPGPLASETVERFVAPWRGAGCPLLLDAEVGASAGGMGVRLDWDAVGRWAAEEPRRAAGGQPPLRWALAGGLDAEQVGEAIRRARAPGVDVASGVEAPRGKKSPVKIAAFGQAARLAWAADGGSK